MLDVNIITVVYGLDLFKMIQVNDTFTLKRTAYWKREGQCLPLREPEKTVL